MHYEARPVTAGRHRGTDRSCLALAGALILRPPLGRLLVAAGLAAAACLALSATARAGDGDSTLPGPLGGAEEVTGPVTEVIPIVGESAAPVAERADPVWGPVVPVVAEAVEPVGETIAPLAPEPVSGIVPIAPLVDPVADAAEPIIDITPEVPPAPSLVLPAGDSNVPSAAPTDAAGRWAMRPSAPVPADLEAAAAASQPVVHGTDRGRAPSSPAADRSPTLSSAGDDGGAWANADVAARIAPTATDGRTAVDETGGSSAGAAALMTTLLLAVLLAGWSVLRSAAERAFSVHRLVPVPPG